MQLLADEMVKLGYADHPSDETVRKTLKKRAQAMAEAGMVHSTEGECHVRQHDGRYPGGLPYEYQREGTCNLFMAFAPLPGWRNVTVTERRTKVDVAYYLRALVEARFPTAERFTVVRDNLNPHNLASLYKAFESKARRIARKLELHYAQAWQLVEYGRD